MNEEQDSFNATIESLNDTVSKFSQYVDLGRVDYVIVETQQTSEQLKKALDNANLFNRREALFNKNITDYSHIKKMITQFEPYENLWKYAHSWKQWQNDWMNGSFLKLDPGQVEKDVNLALKVLYKTSKLFTQQSLEKCSENCETVRSQIEDFMK